MEERMIYIADTGHMITYDRKAKAILITAPWCEDSLRVKVGVKNAEDFIDTFRWAYDEYRKEASIDEDKA